MIVISGSLAYVEERREKVSANVEKIE